MSYVQAVTKNFKYKILLFVFAMGSMLLPGQKAEAAWSPSYIISDAEFASYWTMNEAQIQAFLVQRNSSMKNYVINYDAMVGPNDTINAKGFTASKLIYSVSQWYGLNPQVVLATLEKEQSLVSLSNYVDWRYNSAMGYGCPDSGGCSPNYANFARQVDWGSWQLRWNMDKANYDCPKVTPYCTGRNVSIDGVSTYLGNGATASLYRYTPHFHGNQNFYIIYNSWFNYAKYLGDYFSMTDFVVSNSYPAKGETLTTSFKLKNKLDVAVTLNSVGTVGRLNSPYSNINRDIGWQGPVTFNAGETKSFSFSRTITDNGNIYTWPAFSYQGSYIQYNHWGRTLSVHNPNLTLSQPLIINPTTVYAGQAVTFTATLKNNEPRPIKYSAFGIPVKYYDRYSYDAVWVGPGTINAGATVALSGTRVLDKPGPYTYWAAYELNGSYTTIGAQKKVNVATVVPNFATPSLTFSNTSPARGENLTANFNLKNNLSHPITVSAVGTVGRLNSPYSNINRDIGWQGPVTFNAGETKSFSFTRTLTDVGNHSYWVGILYNGVYIQYNHWGRTLSVHNPNLTLSQPLIINPTTVYAGQAVTFTATLKNNEPRPIKYSAFGIPVKYYDRYSYDAVWVGPGTINAGATVALSGTRVLDKPGPYTYWAAYELNGSYTTIGAQKKVNVGQ